ncbi:hypothetical protein [Photobacterium nomapromontoriensis]|uniref:hypothetical protein n=1 Tax=Photobacterium nomapromontoriensis TaxID=2910237 RepID=UPI003D0D1311
MRDVFVAVVVMLMSVVSVLGWLAMMFASLPGAEVSYAISMRIIRGLFYIYPILSAVSIYFLYRQLSVSYYALLWCLVPLAPIAVVWFIFNSQGINSAL